jgi:hypothetical protein
MKKIYKLIDRGLIRNFGGIKVSLDESVGNRFVRAGKAIGLVSSEERKSVSFPPKHKAIFRPPEEKEFAELGNSTDIKYPGPNDKLFPHIEK